ncbi:MAG: polysaccharide biosynthesis tyrosine autokinase [Actinomycetia bacterium]|nr:polysaccharide biosynthesis tyrosine autokinase [Actinomycetes bacterium]
MMYEQASGANSARLEDYIRAIKTRPFVVILVPLLLISLGFLYGSGREHTYRAGSAVALGPTPVGSINANLAAPVEEREASLLASNQTANAVIDELGLDMTPGALLRDLNVEFIPSSGVLEARYTGSDPDLVAAIANAFTQAYTEQREQNAVDFYKVEIDIVEAQLKGVEKELETIDEAMRLLGEDRAKVLGQEPSPSREEEIGLIDLDLSALRTNRTTAANGQIALARELAADTRALETRQTTAKVIRTTDSPTNPIGIPASYLLFAAGVLGLAAGVAVAFFLEHLDRTARSADQISTALNTAVLGEVPTFSRRTNSGLAAIVMLSESPKQQVFAAQEAYRRLRSAVQFAAAEFRSETGFAVSVSSAFPSEGKSVTSANLGVALAQSGKVVVLVSADLRRPTLETLFGADLQEQGLSSILTGTDSNLPVLESGVENLFLIPAGPMPTNPSELLGTGSFEAVLDDVRTRADFIIVDTPPILSTSDALVVGGYVDGTVLVVDSRRTEVADLLQVHSEFSRAGLVLLGAIVNRVRRRRQFFRKNRYAYAHASNADNT